MPKVWSRENSATPLSGGKEEKQSKNLKYAKPGWSHLWTGLRESPLFPLSPSLQQLNIDSPENQVLWMDRGHSSGSLSANQQS